MEIGDIRRLYDIRDLLSLSARKKWINCPLPLHPHKHYTPSFSIYVGHDGVQRFKCHGNCGAHGDVIDLAGYLWVPGYNPKVSADLAKAYAHSRGLTDESIEKFQIGQDRNYMTMPYFRDGSLRGIKKRNCRTCSTGLRYITETGSRGDLFNIDAVQYSNGHCFLIKAELPTILLDQWGFQAVAPTGGEGSWDDRWRTDLGLSRLTIIGDNDRFGRKLAVSRATKFGARLEYPPREYKDVDEYMLARPEEALSWLQALAT